ncbi:hypothetical protein M2347_002737 [Chryseobacterium sp. H1D6B]|nr:hypothetical protein [Chryseobacterium sp. H1D6B]
MKSCLLKEEIPSAALEASVGVKGLLCPKLKPSQSLLLN